MVIGKDPKADELLRALAPEAQAAVRALGEQLGVEAAARSSGSTSAATTPAPPAPRAPAATKSEPAGTQPAPSDAGTSAPSQTTATPSGAAQVVSSKTGPRRQKVSDEIEQNALAVHVDSPSWELSAQPSTSKELLQIAEVVFKSPMFRAFGSPHGTFAIMSYGRELGLGYMQSLLSFYDVKGRPFMGAHAMRGLVLKSPHCEYLINTECTEDASTWLTRRRGWPEGVTSSYRFTWAEAEAMGLT